MTDRELLEAAARAAGYAIYFTGGAEDFAGRWKPSSGADRIFWNPLTDDGDALRLAVKLGLAMDLLVPGVQQFEDQDPGKFTMVIVGSRKSNEGHRYHALHDGDPYAATRRAIVRAAASLSPKGDAAISQAIEDRCAEKPKT